MLARREFVGGSALALLAAGSPLSHGRIAGVEEMYGLIGQMKVLAEKRGEVIAALIEGTRDMPGNIAYMIAEDIEDATSIWITEVWNTKTDHANSLQLPSVQEAISMARPYITGFGTRVETKPVSRG